MLKLFPESYKNFFLGLFLLLLLFLPNNTMGSIFQILITILILLASNSKKLNSERFFGALGFVKYLFIFFVIISLVFSSLNNQIFYLETVLKILNICVIIVFFPLNGNYVISNKLIIISLLIIILTQISFLFKISSIVNIIETYYTSEEYVNSYEVYALNEDSYGIFNFRFGGIYRNPNQCGRMVTLLYSIFLINRKKITSKDAIYIILFLTSIFLTGSRTSFLIFLVLTAVFFIIINKKKSKKVMFFLPFLILFVIPFINFENRIFDFSELSGSGREASVNAKLDFLLAYINQTLYDDPFKLVFGTFNLDNVEYRYSSVLLNRFDSEFGYLLHGLGFFVIIVIFVFLIKLYVISNANFRFLMIIFLWSFTSTILTNFRFSLIYFLILSFYFNRKKVKKLEQV